MAWNCFDFCKKDLTNGMNCSLLLSMNYPSKIIMSLRNILSSKNHFILPVLLVANAGAILYKL